MAKMSYVLCTVIPLAWSASALAAPPNAPDTAAPTTTTEPRHHGDFATWHKEMCTEHYARTAGHLGYLQAKLGLSEAQQATFAKWRQAVLEQSAKERATCLEITPKANAKPTILEGEAHLEKMLSMKLQSLQATRPALEAVYESLSPEQKTIFDHELRHLHAAHGGHPGPHFGGMEGHGMERHMDMGPGK